MYPEFLQILLDHGLDPNGLGSTWEESYLHGVLHDRRIWAGTKSSLVYRTNDLVKALLKAGAIISTSAGQEAPGPWFPTPLHSLFSRSIDADPFTDADPVS